MHSDSSRVLYSFMSFPLIDTVPEVGFSNPFIHLINVDLPTPLGPIMQYSLDSSMWRSISFNTGLPPYPTSNDPTSIDGILPPRLLVLNNQIKEYRCTYECSDNTDL